MYVYVFTISCRVIQMRELSIRYKLNIVFGIVWDGRPAGLFISRTLSFLMICILHIVFHPRLALYDTARTDSSV